MKSAITATTVVYDDTKIVFPPSPSAPLVDWWSELEQRFPPTLEELRAAQAKLQAFVDRPGPDSKKRTFFARNLHAVCAVSEAKYPATSPWSSSTVTITKGKARALLAASDAYLAESVAAGLTK